MATRIMLPILSPADLYGDENLRTHDDDVSKNDILTVLRNSESVLKHSWCQYSNTSIIHGKTRHCINGAIFESDPNKDFSIKLKGAAHWIMGYTLCQVTLNGKGRLSLAAWNDQIGRSKDDVLSLVRAAISLVESDECIFDSDELVEVSNKSEGS